MRTWIQAEEERYRLDVLRLLAGTGGYEANHRTIGAALGARGHHRPAAAQADALHWLAERGLVETRDEAGYVVAGLTERGRRRRRRAGDGARRRAPDAGR